MSVHGLAVRTVDLTIAPRFRVTQYTAFCSPLNHCDTALEEYTEWDVIPVRARRLDRRWSFDRKTHVRGEVGDLPPDFQPLPDRVMSLEVTAADAPTIRYVVEERDRFIDELGIDKTIDLRPALGSRCVVLSFTQEDDGVHGLDQSACRAEIHADIDGRLLTPGLPTGPVASR